MATKKKSGKKFSPRKGCTSPTKCRNSGKCAKKSGSSRYRIGEGWLPKMVDRWVLLVILDNQRPQVGPQGACCD